MPSPSVKQWKILSAPGRGTHNRENEWLAQFNKANYRVGNLEHSAFFLARLEDGIDAVRRELEEQNIPYTTPGVGIVLPDPAISTRKPLGYAAKHNLVIVHSHYLAEQSLLSPDAHVTGHNDSGEITFAGSLGDFALVTGMEEADHARYRQLHGMTEENMPASSELAGAQYNESQVEFEALQMKLKLAMRYSLPTQTTAVIRQRLEAAMRGRQC